MKDADYFRIAHEESQKCRPPEALILAMEPQAYADDYGGHASFSRDFTYAEWRYIQNAIRKAEGLEVPESQS